MANNHEQVINWGDEGDEINVDAEGDLDSESDENVLDVSIQEINHVKAHGGIMTVTT